MLRGGSAQQRSCSDLRTEGECKKVHGCKWIVRHQSHGHSFGSCWGVPLDWDHLSGQIPDNIYDLPPKYDYVYEEEELPNNKDIYVSTSIESSPPRKGNLRAGESNRRFRALPFDNSSN
eukprot:scaffold4355_cov81-Skeletonema_dohrnii-CCMP3373.AAC.2